MSPANSYFTLQCNAKLSSSTAHLDTYLSYQYQMPPSSLLLAHGPDQYPPSVFGRPYYDGSLQVVVSPCWVLALPGVISAILE